VERLPEQPAGVQKLNTLWKTPPPPPMGGLSGRIKQSAWGTVAPALAQQQEFNSALVQVLNGQLEETARLHAHLREVVGTLVRYLQRVLPVVDARDRVASALATTRAELILEAFDRRQESLGRRVTGLSALRDRLEAVGQEVAALRAALAASVPPPVLAAAAVRAAEDSRYVAFENRYRGPRDEIRRRLSDYLDAFAEQAPVVDLGCGRGEFLDLLRERGVTAIGVESNAQMVAECRAQGLDVFQTDLLSFLREQETGWLGGLFAAQVAEHLPPPVLQAMTREAYRVLRPGGLLVLETVNPRSVTGFLEVYNRDLTHERPLHPDTLSFLLAAEGFTDVQVAMRSPVEASSALQPVPAADLPPAAAAALNENIERLNALLYGYQEYAVFARR
jgi:SAM-dependent methyltransferase